MNAATVGPYWSLLHISAGPPPHLNLSHTPDLVDHSNILNLLSNN